MEHSKHIFRLAILVILVLAGFLIARTLFSPKSFGRFGHYRADNVVEQMAKPVRHGESTSCAQCHDEKSSQIQDGIHITVPCEDCHAPLATHVEKGEVIAQMTKNRSYLQCLRCHEALEARPKGFPQINLSEHLEQAGMEASSDVCLNCHEPHSPKIGG